MVSVMAASQWPTYVERLLLGELESLCDDTGVETLGNVALGLLHELSDEHDDRSSTVSSNLILSCCCAGNHSGSGVLDLLNVEKKGKRRRYNIGRESATVLNQHCIEMSHDTATVQRGSGVRPFNHIFSPLKQTPYHLAQKNLAVLSQLDITSTANQHLDSSLGAKVRANDLHQANGAIDVQLQCLATASNFRVGVDERDSGSSRPRVRMAGVSA